ncbi:MAG: ribonucleoside-triphosphate reductase [Synergistota bacterium]|nr:ribonucleoside-triphosphate reductase [Synergistota bacterium]
MAAETVLKAVETALSDIPGTFVDKKGVFCMNAVIAERKAFLSKQKLSYTARFRVDESAGEVTFTEKLSETKAGLGAGGMDDFGPGAGFRKSKFASGPGGLEGVIDQQSNLFGKKFDFSFNYKRVRETVKQAAEQNGYAFTYKIWTKL